MKLYPIFIILLLCTGCTLNNVSGDWIQADIFKNPPVEYRSAPFYSLNDLLDTTEVIRQVKGFKDAGFGGSFLHSRGGLLTEYLGTEWWEVMDVAVRASKEVGLKVWFYDEDKWPSGFAGGKIPLISEEFHARCLSRIDKNEKIRKGHQLIYEDEHYKYIVNKARMGNGWFNGTCYSDLLNPEVVKSFIDSAYVPYLDRYKKDVGKTVLGIFTDEPQISPRVSDGKEGSVSFSPVIVDRFREMHGYDLIPVIHMLFDTIGNYKKVRYDYYQTISRCFEESFTQQIGNYCADVNAVMTGHLNGEEDFNSAMVNSGNSMINYRHMQMPGIDQLGLHYSPLNVPKSVSSVANQYGISRRMSESYGISGQNMSFEDRKWLLDWLTINGINFIVPHLTSYSMKGERKRDYPPNFSDAQPYWGYNNLFEDYSARMCYVNTIGKYAADLLLIHPLESEYLGVENDSYHNYDLCMNLLQRSHRNFDLGDEQIMSEIARVERNELVMGDMSYKLIVLPSMLVIRGTTLELLERFNAAGGKILVFDNYPEYVDGELNPNAIELLTSISRLVTKNDLVEVLDKILPTEYEIRGEGNELIWTHYREVEQGGILQLSNTSRLKEIDIELLFSSTSTDLALWNPEDGTSMKLIPGADGRIKLHFAATQSWIITFGTASKEVDTSQVYQFPGLKTVLTQIQGPWKGKRLNPNALILDFARYSTDNGKTYSDLEPIIGIHQRLTKERYNGKLILAYELQVAKVPTNYSLVIEQPHLYMITVNDTPINFEGNTFYFDHSFRVQDISGTLREGVNEICLVVDYVAPKKSSLNAIERYGTEIESIYLIGDFAVTAIPSTKPFSISQKYEDKVLVEKDVHHMSRFEITTEQELFENDLVLQGYPFYAGKFLLNNTFTIDKIDHAKQYFLTLPSFESIVVTVRLNGVEYDPKIFSPWEVDITKLLKEGENSVEIELVNSLRNLLGPHHHANGELKEVGPESFSGNPVWPNNGGEYNWYDLRKDGDATLWRDDYCLIPFGLLSQVNLFSSE